jgi:hypothetical protein
VYRLAVSRSGYGCEYMVWLNLGQNKSVIVKTGCIWDSLVCEGMVRLYQGQAMGVSVWPGCI